MPALPRLMCSVACEALYPNTIGADDLAMLLEKPCTEKENTGNLQHTLQRQATQPQSADLQKLAAVKVRRHASARWAKSTTRTNPSLR